MNSSFETIDESINANTVLVSTNEAKQSKKKKNSKCLENLWNYLPRDLGRLICDILGDVDMIGYLRLIAKEWVIQGDEKIHENIARRIYIGQTRKGLVSVQKWGSWLDMLVHRPRLRTNGFYSLRTSYWKPPCNDAFWEEKKREFTEVKFFRHFRFFNDNTCLYALNNVAPRDMRGFLEEEKPIEKKLFLGHYVVQRDEAIVQVRTHYSVVNFRLRIQQVCGAEEGGYDCDYAGHHNSLKILEHSSLALPLHMTALIDENSRVFHELPQYANLLFHREWHFYEKRKSSVSC